MGMNNNLSFVSPPSATHYSTPHSHPARALSLSFEAGTRENFPPAPNNSLSERKIYENKIMYSAPLHCDLRFKILSWLSSRFQRESDPAESEKKFIIKFSCSTSIGVGSDFKRCHQTAKQSQVLHDVLALPRWMLSSTSRSQCCEISEIS